MDAPVFVGRELAPRRSLLTYYFLFSFVAGPAFPILFAVLFFRYRTLRYELDDEGISMRWGALFRREIHLSYDRLQDIHLHSNAIERHLGLARVELQTASGSSQAEIKIEGIAEYEALRDFLYSRMRGAVGVALPEESENREVIALLRQCVEEIQGLRDDLSERGAGSPRLGERSMVEEAGPAGSSFDPPDAAERVERPSPERASS